MSSQVNVDADEVEKFQSIASRWWDTDSEFKTLHDINPLRVSYIERHCGDLSGKKLLDVGCGGGILAEALAQKGAAVTGIDVAEMSLQVARLHLQESGLEVDYSLSTVEDFAAANPGAFDIVTCLEMLEHVPDPASIVDAACRLLRPGGSLVLSTLNRNPKSFALAIIGAEYLLRLLPRGTHEYRRFIKPSELAAAVRAGGLEVRDVTGLSYNPFSQRYSLGRDLDVNYLMTASLDD